MSTLERVGEFIALRDAAKEAAVLASRNDAEALREVWRSVAYNFERLDAMVRPGIQPRMAAQRGVARD